MIKFFNAKQLNPLAKNTSTNNRKQNFNTNLGGLSQDTFEFSNSKHLAFTGKKSKTFEDVQNKFNKNGKDGYKFKLTKNKVDIINKQIVDLNPVNRTLAKNLIIEIGKLYDPERNKELANNIDKKLVADVIKPILDLKQINMAAIGIDIVKNTSLANGRFAEKNLDILDPFISKDQLKKVNDGPIINLVNSTTSAISAIGDIGAQHPIFTKQCYEKIEAIPTDGLSNNTKAEITVQKLKNLVKIAEKNSENERTILETNTINRLLDDLNEKITNPSPYIATAAIKGIGTMGAKYKEYTENCFNKLMSFISNSNAEQNLLKHLQAIESIYEIRITCSTNTNVTERTTENSQILRKALGSLKRNPILGERAVILESQFLENVPEYKGGPSTSAPEISPKGEASGTAANLLNVSPERLKELSMQLYDVFEKEGSSS